MSLLLKGRISFNKKNLPPYVYKFNVALVVFFAAWLAFCLPAMITVGCLYGENPVTYITMGALFALFLIGLLIFCTVALKLRERLVAERTAEIEAKFADMPLEKATEILKQRGTITDYGFITGVGDVFGNRVIPFDRATFCFYTYEINSFIGFEVQIYTDVDFDGNELFDKFDVDGALFNFLDKRGFELDLENNTAFVYLKNDKKNFCRMALGFKIK